MKNKKLSIIPAKHIIVNCKLNDASGPGPEYLGYDFYVKAEKESDMLDHIKWVMKRFNRSMISISTEDKKIYEDKLWTKGKIEECIRKNKIK